MPDAAIQAMREDREAHLAYRLARQRADLIRIETAKIEGCLRAIRDVAGMKGAQAASQAALQRVCRAHMNDNDGWVA